MNILTIVDQVNRSSKGVSTKEKANFEPQVYHENPEVKNEPGESEIKGAIESLNRSVANHQPNVSFSYHEKTKRVIVKILDNETNEVVREIPARHVIRLQESIQEYLGLLIDKSI